MTLRGRLNAELTVSGSSSTIADCHHAAMPILSPSLTLDLVRMERVSDRWYATGRAFQGGSQKPYYVRFSVNTEKGSQWAAAIAGGTSLGLRGQDLPGDDDVVGVDLT